MLIQLGVGRLIFFFKNDSVTLLLHR